MPHGITYRTSSGGKLVLAQISQTLSVFPYLTRGSIIEMNTGIICACLPNLKAFAKRHFPNLFKRPVPALVRPTGYIQRPSPQSLLCAQGSRTRWLNGYFSMSSLKSNDGSTPSAKKTVASASTLVSAPQPKDGVTAKTREQYTV